MHVAIGLTGMHQGLAFYQHRKLLRVRLGQRGARALGQAGPSAGWAATSGGRRSGLRGRA
jgi:hypothetical protein